MITMTNNKPFAIQFNDVSVTLKATPILQNINNQFYKNKITTLVGPSGAGKSTLLKLCNGLLSPTSGQIFVEEKQISQYDPTILRRTVGMALQNAPMIRGTVMDNLALPRKLQERTLTEEEALSHLEQVALEDDLLYQDSAELSGGQRQKVSIARTLINRSRILLLDEITSALDRHSVEEIEGLIQDIQTNYDLTIIWITHSIEQAKRVSDFTWILIDGKLVETGTVDRLVTPQTEAAKNFLAGGVE